MEIKHPRDNTPDIILEADMTYYSLDNNKNPILQIQRILRYLQYDTDGLAKIKPSGIYDEDTKNSVVQFQNKYGLTPTGIVDSETWELLFKIDQARRDASELAKSVKIFPEDVNYYILPNAKDNNLFVIQHMLNEIRNHHDEMGEIEINGIYDKPTVDAIKVLQRKNLMDANGIIDSKTLNILSNEFERLNSRDS